ncbi:MAG TPA: tetratricopeptide repeat protein, partial [Caulobacteraceae bacterium]
MAADVQGPTRIGQAVELLATDPARAEALAREVLSTAPADRDALVVLGTALRVRGELEQARAVLEPLAATETGSWIMQFELARVLLALGKSRAATGPLSLAVALNPGLAAGWRMLGDIALFSGQVSAAQTAYDWALRALIGDPRLQGPAAALAEGRPDVAEPDLRAVLARDPNALAAGHLLGEALARQGRLADAEGLLAQCVERAPGFDLARQSYASVLLRSGKPSQALVQLDRLGVLDNRGRMMRAAALTELGDFGLAAEVTAALLEDFPDQAHGWLLHGNGLRTLGRIDAAIAAYRKCLELDPDGSAAWWALANLKTYRFDPKMRAAIGARLADPALGPEDRSTLHFTLGKAEEDEGRFA